MQHLAFQSAGKSTEQFKEEEKNSTNSFDKDSLHISTTSLHLEHIRGIEIYRFWHLMN